ncbi:MAG: DNA primase [Firmicutes bacterium]|nr:DNA primase [Bacillota bacterium]
MALPEEFLQRLKSANPIESVVSGYVKLRRTGRNLVGLCPFHGEKTPSFVLYPENDSFYCFGCGAGGDTITFIRKIENLDYIEAVKLLAQRAGLEMPEDVRRDDGTAKLKLRILEANREAARFFHAQLNAPCGAKALEYLRGRKLSNSTINHFGLGFAPEGWSALCDHMKRAGFSQQELVMANLASQGRNNGVYDRFRNRVIFPIIDVRGNVIAFSGRVLEKAEPKYLNSSETLVFEKSSVLFALNFAKNSGQPNLILAEGPMDVISLHQAGFTNAVATQGTALTPKHALLIARYAQEVILCYDADAAGQKATARAIPILKNAGLRVRVLTIPEGKDPDEFIKTKGAERFRQLIEDSGNDVEYRMQKIREKYNMETADGRVNMLREAVGMLAGLDSSIEQDVYAGRLAAELKVEKATLLHQIAQARKRQQRDGRQSEQRQIQRQFSGTARDEINPDRARNMRAALAEEALIAYLMRNPDRAAAVRQALPPEKFCTAFNRGVYDKLTGWLCEGRQVSLSDFAEYYSVEEMGRIAQMLAKSAQSVNLLQAERDYISVIAEEHDKPTVQQAVQSSDEDLLKMMEQLRMQKQ